MDGEQRPDLAALQARARTAYECGRLRLWLARAAFVTALIGAAALLFVGPGGLAWLPVTFVIWTALGWRGGALLRGGRQGLIAGAFTFVLPMSLLRPCCLPGAPMSSDCCTMPGMCVLTGALLGLALAWFLPRGPGARRIETAAGMALSVSSVAALKCTALFAGEALGLLGGLIAGIAAASTLAALIDHRRHVAA